MPAATKKPKRYVAFLRGINVGGAHKVEMKKLAALFTRLGFNDVKTYINSGNVIFSSATAVTTRQRTKIEDALRSTFGFAIPIVISTKTALAAICKKVPTDWRDDTHQRTYVFFLTGTLTTTQALATVTINKDVDTIVRLPGAFAWNLEKKYYTKSGMHKMIGTPLYKNTTARSINTVRKLHDLLAG